MVEGRLGFATHCSSSLAALHLRVSADPRPFQPGNRRLSSRVFGPVIATISPEWDDVSSHSLNIGTIHVC